MCGREFVVSKYFAIRSSSSFKFSMVIRSRAVLILSFNVAQYEIENQANKELKR